MPENRVITWGLQVFLPYSAGLNFGGNSVDDRHQQQNQKRHCVVQRTFPRQVSVEKIQPMNCGKQESEEREEVMYRGAAIFVEDAPNGHQAQKNS